MERSEKLVAARCRLLTREPWYGHIAMSMVWSPHEMDWLPEYRRTMGVRIMSNGTVECIYYPPFVDSLTIEELYAVIKHEIEHVVRLHCLRKSDIANDRDHALWNIAADMTVNGRRDNPRIGYHDTLTGKIIVPMADSLVWIPADWPDDLSAEQYYDMLLQAGHKCDRCPACHGNGGDGDEDASGDGNDASGDGNDASGDGNDASGDDMCPCCKRRQRQGGSHKQQPRRGEVIDDHSVWDQSDICEKDEARRLIKSLVDQATDKSQGYSPGHLRLAIEGLSEPIVNWRSLLRHYLGRHVGNQRRTYSRRNRRNDRFGMPGISHHAAATVNVIVDTSASITQKDMQQFFAEVEAIASMAKLYLLQWDAVFQAFCPYRRGDWKKISIKGGGGTDMAAPLQWLMDNGLIADVQITLTDGYCNYLPADRVRFPCITVITANGNTIESPKYGIVVRMGK